MKSRMMRLMAEGFILATVGFGLGLAEHAGASRASTFSAVPAVSTSPPREDCTENLKECLGTRLQRNCADCYDRCRGEKKWPDETYDGRDCRWWKVRR